MPPPENIGKSKLLFCRICVQHYFFLKFGPNQLTYCLSYNYFIILSPKFSIIFFKYKQLELLLL